MLGAAMVEAPTGAVRLADRPTIVDLPGGWLVLRRDRRHTAGGRVR
ncbi:MAG TPA: hypothetical protein VFO16_13720 [Pseudonocardiaceae bacterium]|nr:hypothetical protein [Pseudonocardiaceae bacterium]